MTTTDEKKEEGLMQRIEAMEAQINQLIEAVGQLNTEVFFRNGKREGERERDNK